MAGVPAGGILCSAQEQDRIPCQCNSGDQIEAARRLLRVRLSAESQVAKNLLAASRDASVTSSIVRAILVDFHDTNRRRLKCLSLLGGGYRGCGCVQRIIEKGRCLARHCRVHRLGSGSMLRQFSRDRCLGVCMRPRLSSMGFMWLVLFASLMAIESDTLLPQQEVG